MHSNNNMKKIILLASFITGSFSVINAQPKQHRIVFEITTPDTAQQRTMLRQISNVVKDAPGITIEVVCHGPAIFMLVKDKTVLLPMMDDLKNKQGISFAACANSMRKNNIVSSQLVPVATIVPNGVMEVVSKQEDGWSYIKAGE